MASASNAVTLVRKKAPSFTVKIAMYNRTESLIARSCRDCEFLAPATVALSDFSVALCPPVSTVSEQVYLLHVAHLHLIRVRPESGKVRVGLSGYF